MLYLGIALLVFGIILLISTQIVLRKLIVRYRKEWEDKDEMS